jgi:hypothetical protein
MYTILILPLFMCGCKTFLSECVQEQGVKENIWGCEIGSYRRLEIAALWRASWFVLNKQENQTKLGKMGWACVIHGGEEKCIQGFGGRT